MKKIVIGIRYRFVCSIEKINIRKVRIYMRICSKYLTIVVLILVRYASLYGALVR